MRTTMMMRTAMLLLVLILPALPAAAASPDLGLGANTPPPPPHYGTIENPRTLLPFGRTRDLRSATIGEIALLAWVNESGEVEGIRIDREENVLDPEPLRLSSPAEYAQDWTIIRFEDDFAFLWFDRNGYDTRLGIRRVPARAGEAPHAPLLVPFGMHFSTFDAYWNGEQLVLATTDGVSLHVYRLKSSGAIVSHEATPPIPPSYITTRPFFVGDSAGELVSWGITVPCRITCVNYPDTTYITRVDDLRSISVPARQQSFPLVTRDGRSFLMVEDDRSAVVVSRVASNGTIVSSRRLPELLFAVAADSILTTESLIVTADGFGSAVAAIDPLTLETHWIAAHPSGWSSSTFPWNDRIVWSPMTRVAETGSVVTASLSVSSSLDLSSEIVDVEHGRDSRSITIRVTNHSRAVAQDTRVIVLGHVSTTSSEGFVTSNLGLVAPVLAPGESRELVVLQTPIVPNTGKPWYQELSVSVAGPIPDLNPANNSATLWRADVERTLRRGVRRP